MTDRPMDSQHLWSVVRRLLRYLGAVRGLFAVSLLFLLLATSLTAAKAWIVQPTVDGFLQGPTRPEQLWILCAVVLAIFWTQAVFNWLYLVSARMVSARIVQAVRGDLFRHLQQQSLGYFAKRSSGDLISRVISDVSAFDVSAISALQGIIRNGLALLFLLGVLLMQDVVWGLICFAVMLIAGTVLRSVGGRLVSVARDIQDSLAMVTHQLSEMIAGVAVILSFGAARDWNDRFSLTNEQQYATQVRAARIRASATATVDLITGAALAGILLWMGLALLNGTLTAGQLLSFVAVAFLMQAPAQRLAHCAAGLATGLAAGGRAFEILDEMPRIREPDRPRAPRHGGSLEFRAVSFEYGDERVLDDVSFRLRPGELVVMAGRSGAGKSTVARLGQRFHDPVAGRVLIDGIDVRELHREDLCRTVSYVAQDVFLFNDTIESNIRIGAPRATARQLDEAVRVACLDDVIEELPAGLQSVVGERGVRLSGGQQQRIAIARALLMPAPILIFDESTSALDADLEQRVFQNLITLPRKRTVLAITHRLTVAEMADRILVLRQGRLVEEGTWASLAAAGGEFSRLQSAASAQLVR